LDEHVDALRCGRGDRLAHDVGLNGQLATAPVYKYGQGDSPWPAEIGELVEGGANGSAGVEHVVHDDDALAVDVDRNLRLADDRTRADGLEIVAVERDVQRTAGDVGLLALADRGDDLRRELDAAALNADDHEIVGPLVQFNDLVGHPPNGSVEGPRVEDSSL